MARTKTDKVFLTCRIDRAMKAKLDELAIEADLDTASLVRAALRRFLVSAGKYENAVHSVVLGEDLTP